MKRSQLAVVLLALAASAAVAGVAPAAAGDPDRRRADKRAPELEISVTP